MTKQSNVIVIGSSNTDMVVKSRRLPVPGETVIGGEFVLAAGGKGANQAVAAARLGANVTFVAKVGEDVFGNQAVAGYQKDGVNTDFIFRDAEHASGVALILVDESGENLISVASGANGFLTPSDIEKAESAIAAADVIVTQLETPLDVLEYTAKLAEKHHVPLILDPAPAPDVPIAQEIFRNVTCIKPNEHEAERLTGIAVTDVASAQKAAERLLDAGVKIALITLGSEGALLVEERGKGTLIPAYKVTPTDTTAAGDAFSGALAWGVAAGKSFAEAAQTASAVAALSVTRIGAQPSLPTREELEKFLLH